MLRQAADPGVAKAIEALLSDSVDRNLNRINALQFADRLKLDPGRTIAGFLQATRLGLFDLSWNVMCPGCGGVLGAGTTLKSVNRSEYTCALCAAGYEPTLDEMVEVTFTVNPRIRSIEAHAPDQLPFVEYYRQIFWTTGIVLPDNFEQKLDAITLERVELPPRERAILSLTVEPQFLIVFDPVTHASQFLNIEGEPTRERQNVSFVLDEQLRQNETINLRPGPLRVALENRTSRRTLPGIWIANEEMHDLIGRRRPVLTAKRVLSHQTFRDLYRTGMLDLDQRLKITSLTFMFTDLKGSTRLYDRVGDLAAFDLVLAHFRLLEEIIAGRDGAVVKTIGDAVMATFTRPEDAIVAALDMRSAMQRFNADHQAAEDELLIKIGLHQGPCLAVTLNERQDYFGQTVNVASRVQELAGSQEIIATEPIVTDAGASRVLLDRRLSPMPRQHPIDGLKGAMSLFSLP
ncbi:MAG: adenylate/guanylate cyclase domain-containing protein [Hyphomicrobiaceae bacterium]|nr:MAG: adenylate/guanylate cyclase domain-containing protein [Hyphomicrobiaceae bacterium]